MRFGLVDRVYTRIGASDNVARGRSTFMVEMTETATILNTATTQLARFCSTRWAAAPPPSTASRSPGPRSSTSTADIGARTLFATHYHELTLLADQLPRLKQSARRRQGNAARHRLPARHRARRRQQKLRHRSRTPRRTARSRHRARPPGPRAARTIRARNVAVETEAALQLTMFTPLSQRILDRLTKPTSTPSPLYRP